jgi:hypothetical protein
MYSYSTRCDDGSSLDHVCEDGVSMRGSNHTITICTNHSPLKYENRQGHVQKG